MHFCGGCLHFDGVVLRRACYVLTTDQGGDAQGGMSHIPNTTDYALLEHAFISLSFCVARIVSNKNELCVR